MFQHRPFRRLFRLRSRTMAAVEAEFREEIDAHLALAAEQLERQGVPAEEARAQARERFGDLDGAMATLVASATRREATMHRREWWGSLRQNLKIAARQLRRSPGMTATIALTLALGIGANLVMLDVVDRMLLSPPPALAHPAELRRVLLPQPDFFTGGTSSSEVTNYAAFQDLASVRSFAGVGAYAFPQEMSLGRGRDASPIQVNSASASFFRVLGVKPWLGRFYTEAEDYPLAGAPVAVVSYAFWKRALGGDPAVLGHVLPIGSQQFTVVGVAPPRFNGVDLAPVDVWIPITTQSYSFDKQYLTDRGSSWMMVVARLAPGTDPERATSEASAVVLHANDAVAKANPHARVELASIIAARGPGAHPDAAVAIWLLGVAAIVLVIACTNVATLLLTRALRRQQEMAVRLALGVSRRRLLGQLLTEATLLASLATGVALFGAALTRGMVQHLLLPDVAVDAGPSVRTVAITLGAVIAVTLIAALAPAMQTLRVDVVSALKSSSRTVSAGRGRLRSGLLVLQVALSVMLLVGAGLFVLSLRNATGIRVGLDPDRVLLAQVDLSGGQMDSARQDSFWQAALQRMRTVPQVESAALSIGTPFQFSMAGPFMVPGRDSLPRLRSGGPYRYGVGPGFFSTIGARVLHGRAFTEADGAGAQRVIVISETTARLLWPHANPIGQCVRTFRDDTIPCATIVGIVEDVHRQQLREEAVYQYYMPYAQWRGAHSTALLVRLDAPANSRTTAAVRRALQEVSPDVPFPQVSSYADIIDPQLRSWRLGATMFSVFGTLAALVAFVGLYGLLAYSVAQRRYEFGIRAALGARAVNIAGLVLRRGFALVLGGLVIGLVAAAVISPRVSPLLLEVSSHDVTVYASIVLIVLVATLLASVIPTRRAAAADPMEALRAE